MSDRGIAMLLAPDPNDSVAAARGLLPWTAVWGSTLLYLAVGTVLLLLVLEVSTCIAGRRLSAPEGGHWTDRARRQFELQVALSKATMIVVIAFASGAIWFVGVLEPIGLLPLIGWSASLLGAAALVLVRWRRLRSLLPERAKSFRAHLWGTLGILLTFSLPQLVTLSLVAFFPYRPGPAAYALWTVGAAFIVYCFFGGIPRAMRLVGLGLPADAELQSIVEECSAQAGVQVRRTWSLDLPIANAFAFVLCNELAVTKRAQELLAREELAAILHHELGHLKEPLRVKAVRALIIPALVAVAAFRPLTVLGQLGLRSYLVGAALFLGLIFALRRLGRGREQHADEHAHAHIGDAATFARALERIHEANLSPAVLRRKSTHPHLYDRMVAAGLQPDYPRPAPPSAVPGWTATLTAALLALLLLAGSLALRQGAWATAGRDEPATLRRMALTGGTPWDLGELARIRASDQRPDEALTLLAAAEELDPENPWHAYQQAWILKEAGRLDEARSALSRAEDAVAGWWGDDDILDAVEEMRIEFDAAPPSETDLDGS